MRGDITDSPRSMDALSETTESSSEEGSEEEMNYEIKKLDRERVDARLDRIEADLEKLTANVDKLVAALLREHSNGKSADK
jgi:hypothetical protein